MAKRISKYDLTDDLRDYLVSLWNKTKEYTNSFQYADENLSDARIVYIRNLDNLQVGVDEGLLVLEKMQKYKVIEQTALRKNARNYHKKYYRGDELRRIETYSNAEIDVIFIASYREGARYLFPFLESKAHYPTYTHVLHRQDDITEEYMCSSAQIVYSRYEKVGEKYSYLGINYAPNGTYRILGYETGVLEVTDTILYHMEKEYTWYKEFRAEKKGCEFIDPDIDGIKRAED